MSTNTPRLHFLQSTLLYVQQFGMSVATITEMHMLLSTKTLKRLTDHQPLKCINWTILKFPAQQMFSCVDYRGQWPCAILIHVYMTQPC